MKYKRTILCIGDMHVGSSYALFPKNYKTKYGGKIGLNETQQIIYDYWKETTTKIQKEFNPDTILLLGDLVQGLHIKRRGEDVLVCDLEEQERACLELLRPICYGKKVAGIRGTDYHGSIDRNIESDIIVKLGGDFLGYAGNVLFKGTNRRANIIHGTSKASNHSSASENEIKNFNNSYAKGKLDKFDLFIRAHYHISQHHHLTGCHYIINPCWQAFSLDSYTTKNYGKWQPDIGCTLIRIDEKDRITVYPFIYKGRISRVDRIRSL